MPTFATPTPISVRIDLSGGSVRVRGERRDDTVVDVRPRDDGSNADAQLAEQTRVEYADGRLTVSVPRRPRLLFFGGMPSVDVDVLVPEGSRLEVSASAGDVDCEGPPRRRPDRLPLRRHQRPLRPVLGERSHHVRPGRRARGGPGLAGPGDGVRAVEAGIREGTAAWLDVASASGRVRNLLTASDQPAPSTDSLRVRARSACGDVVLRRA